MGLFGKKEVPDELPSLAIDEVNKKVSAPEGSVLPQQFVQQPNSAIMPVMPAPNYRPLPKQEAHPVKQEDLKSSLSQFNADDDKGYFKELIKSVTEDDNDVNNLESWYKNEFLPRDMVFQMREYWQKQQPEILMKNVSGELKQKLMMKTERLHTLEKEWQEIYFNLLSKEEDIRKEEKELKETLSEFMNLAKAVSGSNENEEKVRKK